MLENMIYTGAPSFFPPAKISQYPIGTGGFCSQDSNVGIAEGLHTFLPFVPRAINWVAMNGQDVISGPFSGCIMATYIENKIRKVCHVSTGSDFGDCMERWNREKQRFTGVKEFKPSDFIDGTPHLYCYGLITASLEAYTILTQPKRVALETGGYGTTDPQFIKKIKASWM